MEAGLSRRMARILGHGRPLFVFPIDDALISGPTGSLREPRQVVKSVLAAGAQSVLGYAGALRWCARDLHGAGFIQNLSASTIRSRHTDKVIFGSVTDAVRNGADGVAVHLNVSSQAEPEILRDIGRVAAECRSFGMPILVISYPRRRGELDKDENYLELRSSEPSAYATLVAHCARIAAELGADIVKVPFAGSVELMSEVVNSTMGVPVLVAGGVPASDDTAVSMAVDSVLAGAAGVAFGRQTFKKPATEAGAFTSRVLRAMDEAMPGPEAMLVGSERDVPRPLRNPER